jgi:oxygen-independent coproporphyrinogen-3 oxidase
MCHFETGWFDTKEQCQELYEALSRLEEPEKDGLVLIEPYHLKVTPKGRAFIRNISMAFDARLWDDVPQTAIFSQTF